MITRRVWACECVCARPSVCARASARLHQIRAAASLCVCVSVTSVMVKWTKTRKAESLFARSLARPPAHSLISALWLRRATKRASERLGENSGAQNGAQLTHERSHGRALARPPPLSCSSI